jgi:pSer/pThr/pTyr-binding forkhead associated (FHA) protein
MKAMLVPIDSPGKPIEITKELMLVGRHAACDIRLDHRTVSKLHCVVAKSEGMLLLRDLGSTNGCRVNGQRIKRAPLLHNDVLSIAVFDYRIVLRPEVEAVRGEEPVRQGDATDLMDMGSDIGYRRAGDDMPPADD